MKVPTKPVFSLNDVIQGIEQNIRTRAYELFVLRGMHPGRELEDWYNASSELLRQPHFELSETEFQTNVEFHVIEDDARDCEVLVSDRTILLVGKKVSAFGLRLFKLVSLSRPVDIDSIRADYSNGRLHCSINAAQSSFRATA